MKYVKKGIFCLITSSVFAVLWLLLLNLFESLISKNYEFISFLVFIIVSICIAIFFTKDFIKQKDKNILKKISIVILFAIMSFTVIVGVFYLVIFGLLYHNYP